MAIRELKKTIISIKKKSHEHHCKVFGFNASESEIAHDVWHNHLNLMQRTDISLAASRSNDLHEKYADSISYIMNL